MDEEIDRAIKILAAKIVTSVQPDQALKFTQSALNLAHVKLVLTGDAKDRKVKGRRLDVAPQKA